jgi:protein SCO1/2
MKSVVAALILLFATRPPAVDEAQISIPDVAVIDQNGQQLRFYSDLVKGRIVVMNFIFTSCTTICSPMGANFAALQRRLGNRNDVALISVSIDPATDTPSRLKSWSARFQARPGWTLVTGKKNDVERLLRSLRVYSVSPASHAPIAIVGSDVRGRWQRMNGLLAPDKLAAMIDELRTPAPQSEKSVK